MQLILISGLSGSGKSIVLKVLEDQGLLRATGKTIVVFNARPKMKTRPVVVPVKGGAAPVRARPIDDDDDDDEDDDDED